MSNDETQELKTGTGTNDLAAAATDKSFTKEEHGDPAGHQVHGTQEGDGKIGE